MRIGIDIGGVIIDRVKNGHYDTSFKVADYTATPAVEDSFSVIKEITELYRPENVFLVSVCDENTEQKTNEWLIGNQFYALTNLLPANVYNCRKRAHKAVIASKLELTHFIDDRLDVLEYMRTTVPNLYLFNPPANKQDNKTPGIIVVASWKEMLSFIKSSLN